MFLTCIPIRADLQLTSRNSQVKIDPLSPFGVYDWIVDGMDVMSQQWFWIRTSSDSRETALGSDSVPLTNAISAKNRGIANYEGNGYTVGIKFTLSGGANGSLASDLAELITITNTSTDALDLTFFQYANIQFSPSDTVQFLDQNRVRQYGSSAVTAAGGVFLNETIVNTDGLVHHQAATVSTIFDSLNDDGRSELNDNASATGNAAWAFEWHKLLNAGESFLITKDLNVSDPPPAAVPEPYSLVLLGTTVLLCAAISRKRSCRA